jgi:hypothetical protein
MVETEVEEGVERKEKKMAFSNGNAMVRRDILQKVEPTSLLDFLHGLTFRL